jgi:hypothetical protein
VGDLYSIARKVAKGIWWPSVRICWASVSIMNFPFTISCALALASLCLPAAALSLPDGRVELVGVSEIRISGIITPKVADEFAKLLTDEVNLLSISSEGGVTEAAIDIAEIIQRRNISVKVIDICLSSCANYLFVAGFNREVIIGAVVGWHGGHSFKPFRSATDSGGRLAEKEKLLLREQLLYARAKVSIDLIVYSGIVTLGEQVGSDVRREYSLWSPSAEELRRLGVTRLRMSEVERTPKEIRAYLESIGFSGQSVYTGKAYSYLPQFLSK